MELKNLRSSCCSLRVKKYADVPNETTEWSKNKFAISADVVSDETWRAWTWNANALVQRYIDSILLSSKMVLVYPWQLVWGSQVLESDSLCVFGIIDNRFVRSYCTRRPSCRHLLPHKANDKSIVGCRAFCADKGILFLGESVKCRLSGCVGILGQQFG